MSRRRVLFVFWHPGQLRSFERPLSLMAQRGHRLHVVFERPRERIPGQLDALYELAAAYENVTVQLADKAQTSTWDLLVRRVRLGLDHLHYFHPRFAAAPEYRARAAEAAPWPVRRLARLSWLRPALGGALRAVERAAPVGALATATIDEFAPDVVAITPYVWFGAPQTDWTRAAHARGVPVVASMLSWDNLTSKGSTRAIPDLMTVWNEAQRDEAAILHRVPPDRIEVTGAQSWDLWFDWQPSRARGTFLAEVGLSTGDGPLILYLESSAYVGNEESFAPEWLAVLHGHADERLRRASVLVRPHPQVNSNNWEAVRSESPGRVAVWPPDREAVQNLEARRNFFDSLYHADAVVGINTSAFIEAAIVGRPSLAPALSQFRKGQVHTIHFAHLVEENGGPVRLASTLQEHADQLAAALRDPTESVERARAFVGRFVRPHGLEEPATPRFVDALERAATLTPAGPRREPGAHVLRLLLQPVALAHALMSSKKRRELRSRLDPRCWVYQKALVRARARSEPSTQADSQGAGCGSQAGPTSPPKPSPKAVKAKGFHGRIEQLLAQTRERLEALADQDGPILVGPYLSEVGYELLYWLPFVRWAVDEFPSLRDRLVYISRGGAGTWAQDLASEHLDIFSLREPAEVLASRSGQKQRSRREDDGELIRAVQREMGQEGGAVLHPSMMFDLYYECLSCDQRAFARSVEHGGEEVRGLAAIYRQMDPGSWPAVELHCEEDFYAVRFYTRPSFPGHEDNRRWVREVVSRLAERRPVVLLTNEFVPDDHADFPVEGPRVTRIGERTRAADNLAQQTAVIARSTALVGTYGGLSYLAPFLGKPAVGFMTDPRHARPWHLDLAQQIFRGTHGWGTIVSLHPSDLDTLAPLLPDSLMR